MGSFDTLWNSGDDFEFASGSPKWCEPAERYLEWLATDVYRELIVDGVTIVTLNQAKVMLGDRYFSWRTQVDNRHRDHIGPRGHPCIYHDFVQGYERLLHSELGSSPPKLYEPAPPPPQQVVDLGGTVLGVKLDDGDR